MSRARPSTERPAFSVGAKLAGATIVLVALVAIVLFVAASRHERRSLLAARQESALMLARLNSDSLAPSVTFGDADGMKEVITDLARNDQVLYVGVWPADPRAPAGVGPIKAEIRRTEADIAPPAEIRRSPQTRVTPDLLVVETAVIDAHGKVVGMAQAGFSLARENAAIRAIEREVLMISVGVGLLLTLVLMGLARRLIVRPLARLAVAARSLEVGEPAVIEAQSNDEIGSLARALQAMSGAIANREQRLGERNRDMSLLLANVEEGFLMIDRTGKMSAERSGVVDTWFGPLPPDGSLFSLLEGIDETMGLLFRLGWDEVLDGTLPREVALDQLPTRFHHQGRSYEMRFRPILEGEELVSMLVVLRDVTERVEHERAEVTQREMAAIFHHLMLNRVAFGMFHDEAQSLVSAIELTDSADRILIGRQVHTLKGNCLLFGIESVAVACHAIESRMSESGEEISAEEKARLVSLWERVDEACTRFGKEGRGDRIELDEMEYKSFVDAVRARIDHRALSTMVGSWKHESAARRLDRLAEQMQSLATQLGRAELSVDCAPTLLRLPPRHWGPFWSVFTHVMRNMIDHGIEPAREREAAGKPAGGRVTLAIAVVGDAVLVSIGDDGRGVAWSKLAAKGRAMGLPVETQADLVEAMFTDGLSSRDEVTTTSGRGVGMGAVRAVVTELGGRVEVDSASGKGTTFRFVLPRSMVTDSAEGVVVPLRSASQPARAMSA